MLFYIEILKKYFIFEIILTVMLFYIHFINILITILNNSTLYIKYNLNYNNLYYIIY
ncbi:unknown [Fusobacterium nucleatum subsp. nucleatum ATCC 25586]|uniref:Uncharacterized protein n=1 Tax=Fusobacterium nucleatum subsp. nucleatum (strain ATCC 25586 / DSM 15643 / BCRC 10681 / CIP 101130 / JCM 8532 / KCTC 2640 / LMG 13131 / VPI 4355) TaxID=190304 RepID=Q8RGZ9_FUSNN|nr:unknown [Fusobacterium nucleatum subsp. nucleatum ATCC 25586]